ncbi:cytidine deaminase [Streptococcus dysgalactiae]|uniref:cytidine deaminase n=1 Tax=Streptococcus dysgalactiae TaxID=1334 RepID=UPI0001F865DE|nr:cytidine deaminase [Streptococcus dysgalactiae]EFY02761.1 cytidine deaminase [Streptococcus dysgalactiae subsp. dysgalactiae ATCC 27957]MCB2829417.1 cytidine deaminase [Streptococcus dysgalactiae subsp. dysgalactiae]MCB2831696.1 cytidine deaminase [Streptococcus dysgalactiae subsp. dysgalactiae]MCB2835403.1 cytidine deaminase [Streptococcus dysgalactiae subsp. dysgalactiae]MCB2837566.1 cytidine deaminase [Streptococcus dysgalactiae subsp. dysgalactiae]
MVATDLVSLAIDASKHAYVPYSHFPIGAALKTKDGTIYTGCNIENASFGLTNCGERTAIFKAVSDGHKELAEIAIYGETQEPVSPCGACRQVMVEFFEPSSLVTLIAQNGQTLETTVGDLLPYSFTDLS